MVDLGWWIRFQNPVELWKNHRSYMTGEIVYYFLAFLTFRHAWRHGGRYLWLWFTVVGHGLTTECITYYVPDIDNFWHSQNLVMLLGGRLPLYIVVFYAVFLYTASVIVSKLHLKWWAEPFAVGLCVVMIDVPYDIMGVNLLWWTWHDTDPNIYDRFYWVPWTSFYFHATFASSLTFLFHGTRRLVSPKGAPRFQAMGFFTEFFCSLPPILLSFGCGCLQFIPIYHSLHDLLKIHSEVCFFILLVTYLGIIWMSDRNPSARARKREKGWFDEIAIHPILHYGQYFLYTFIESPENYKAIGLHEPIGECKSQKSVQTAFGLLYKRKYLCATDYDEAYFDWHCLPGGKPPPHGSSWYTACGVAFPNRAEYNVVVGAVCAFGLFIFWNLLRNSGDYPETGAKKIKSN